MIRTRAAGNLLVTASILLGSCTPYQVRTDYDEDVSFGEKRTFAWLDSTRRELTRQDSTRQDSTRQNNTRRREDEASNPFLERRVKRAVETAMVERGLTTADSNRADLLVTAFVIGPERYDRQASRWFGTSCGPSLSVWFGRSYYPFGFRRSGWAGFTPISYWGDAWGYACSYRVGYGYGWLPLYGTQGRHLAGTLVVDILDGETRELLWRGSAEGALIDVRRSDQSQEEIDRIVREVLKTYPPRASQEARGQRSERP